MIPQLLGTRPAAMAGGAGINISPNSSLPGSSQVSSFLGGIEQWAIYACLLGLIVGGASLWWGVQNGSINRTSVSQHKILAALGRGDHHRRGRLPHHVGVQLRLDGELRR